MTDLREEIYKEYHDKIYGYIYSKVSDCELAEDLCSDVFLKICEKFDTYDQSKAAVSTWVYTIARNRMTDYFRTRHVSEEISDELEEDYSIEEGFLNKEMLENLAIALEKLDERSRDIIILHYYHEMTLRDVAVKIGISYAYARILHTKAIKKLSDIFVY